MPNQEVMRKEDIQEKDEASWVELVVVGVAWRGGGGGSGGGGVGDAGREGG